MSDMDYQVNELPEPYGLDRPLPSKVAGHISIQPGEQLYYVSRRIKPYFYFSLLLPTIVGFIGIIVAVAAIFITFNARSLEANASFILSIGILFSIMLIAFSFVLAQIKWYAWSCTFIKATNRDISVIVSDQRPVWLKWFVKSIDDPLPYGAIANITFAHNYFHDIFKTGVIIVDTPSQKDELFHHLAWFEDCEELSLVIRYFVNQASGTYNVQQNLEIIAQLQGLKSILEDSIVGDSPHDDQMDILKDINEGISIIAKSVTRSSAGRPESSKDDTQDLTEVIQKINTEDE